MARAVGRVACVAALALVLGFGVPPANAGESSVWAALERPDGALLSGLQACGPALDDGTSEGSQCLAGWSVQHLLLDGLARFATERGQRAFGKHFRIVNNLDYSPGGSGLIGGLDVVLPLGWSASAASPGSRAFFFQQGVTRWVDEHGTARNDFRFGAVRRFSVSGGGAASGVVGVSGFVQQSREYRHTRLVAGADYAGKWGRGTLNLFVPATGWVPAQAGYEERALAGIELGVRFDLTTTLSLRTGVERWEEEDGLGGWSTNGRAALGWRPHPWLDLGVGWSGLGTGREEPAVRLAFSMPLGERGKAPAWEGMGRVGGGPNPSAMGPWSPVENIDVIRVARRASAPARVVSEATVRFLQDSASSGDEIRLRVSLAEVTPRDLRVVVTLMPGAGENPAVPGVDYVDEPIPVTIQAGTSSSVVAVQLPLNAGLREARSLRATVALSS